MKELTMMEVYLNLDHMMVFGRMTWNEKNEEHIFRFLVDEMLASKEPATEAINEMMIEV